MLLGLHFDGTVDLTGIATILLAFGTLVLAAVTRVVSQRTAQLAKETRAAVSLEQEQLNRSQRPVLIPLHGIGDVRYHGGTVSTGQPTIYENPDRPDLPAYGHLLLPVKNVGTGPALNVRGQVSLPRGRAEVDFPVVAVGVADDEVVTYVRTGGSLDFHGLESLSGSLVYEDVAGKRYMTTFEFDSGHNAYRSAIREVASE